MKFLLPQGIGDSIWALHKVQSAAQKLGANSIEISLNCSSPTLIQSRSLDFMRKFDFVKSADMVVTDIHPPFPNPPVDEQGRYVYIDSGWTYIAGVKHYALMPNGSLERGMRLEDWLPEFDVDWETASHFQFSKDELDFANRVKETGEYAVFYLGPLSGNLHEGHNRGPLWYPGEWVSLGKRLQRELGLKIVIVGAEYDYPYFQALVEPLMESEDWINLIGKTSVGMLYAVTKQARFVISYQSGVGIFSSYLGVPTGIFWRPKGNSINPNFFLSFEEAMASAWTKPAMISSGKHLPLIYGRHGVDYIVDEVKERGW